MLFPADKAVTTHGLFTSIRQADPALGIERACR